MFSKNILVQSLQHFVTSFMKIGPSKSQPKRVLTKKVVGVVQQELLLQAIPSHVLPQGCLKKYQSLFILLTLYFVKIFTQPYGFGSSLANQSYMPTLSFESFEAYMLTSPRSCPFRGNDVQMLDQYHIQWLGKNTKRSRWLPLYLQHGQVKIQQLTILAKE